MKQKSIDSEKEDKVVNFFNYWSRVKESDKILFPF